MNIYESRWNNALKWAKKVKEHFDTGNYFLEWDGQCYNSIEYELYICEDTKKISINFKKGGCVQWIYEYDLEWDHGSYTSIEKTNKMLADINLFMMTKVKL